MTIIDLKNISCTPDPYLPPVLKNINWTVNQNERWILFGANGSGKSMLLQIITGYRRNSHGSIDRFGEGETGTDIRQVRKKIGYVASGLRSMVFPNETIIDLVISGHFATIGLYDTPHNEIREKAEELLVHTGLMDRKNDLFSHLSDGEKQKIMMARALINSPELLILDEPASALDIAAREDLLITLHKMLEGHKGALIYVTHHIEEITPLFSHCLMLKKGGVFKIGSIDDTINGNVLSSLFGIPLSVTKNNGRFVPLLSAKGATQS
ncbi:MAG TPA: ATP-binding cassette domain-containing protein [Spirochaetota bacterium]|nr:ATP-binding cassette domain-containing protein [Spirochaetota bacterium]